MKLIDEKGRLFGTINIIDLLIIILVVLLAIGFSYKIKTKNTASIVKEVTVTVRIPFIYPEEADSLKKGDQLVSGSDFIPFYIEDVIIKPAAYLTTTSDGRALLVEHPLRKDVFVTIKGKATIVGASIKIANQEAKIGKEFYIKTLKTELKGFVSGIDIK